MLTGRGELPTLGWAAVAARAVALIWEFARIDILTIRGECLATQRVDAAQVQFRDKMAARFMSRCDLAHCWCFDAA